MAKNYLNIKYISLAAAAGGLLFGFDTAVISGTIGMVKDQYHLSSSVEGWFVSSGLVGCIIGVIFAGLLSDKFGRKMSLILSAVLFCLSAFGCAFAPFVNFLISSRLIGGIAVGIVSVTAPMFISEFAPPKSRGSLVAVYQLAITVGIVLAYLSNALLLEINGVSGWLSSFGGDQIWRAMFLMMFFPSMIFLGMIMTVPESPRWLLSKERADDAYHVLSRVFPREEAAREFHSISKGINEHKNSGRNVFSKSVRMPLIIGVMVAIFQQLCGINAIIYYGPKIFQEAGFTSGSALQTQAIIGIANLLFTLLAIYQADKFGRKPLLIIGLIGIILSLITVGAAFYSGHTTGLLLVVAIIVFVSSFAFSLGPITWVLINEIFPNDVRLKGVSICTLTVWISVWAVGQFFPWALQNLGAPVVFWIFAGISLASLVFSLKLLKETKGQSLEDIEIIYAGGH